MGVHKYFKIGQILVKMFKKTDSTNKELFKKTYFRTNYNYNGFEIVVFLLKFYKMPNLHDYKTRINHIIWY